MNYNIQIESGYRVVSIMVSMMTTIIVLGSFCTAGVMKVLGYKDLDQGWNSISVFVRSHGYSFLVVPFVWGLFVMLSKGERQDTIAALGVILVYGLATLFIYTTFGCRLFAA